MIINVSVLCGTFPQESRNAISKSLETMASKEGNQTFIPIAVKWDRIRSNGNQPKSTEAIFLNANWKMLYGSPVHFHVTMALQLQIVTPSDL